MGIKETDGLSPEQQQAYQQLAGFFGGAEREYPAAAKQLVSVIGGLVGGQRTTREKLQGGMGNIDVGLALIGDWLKETGADGFEVELGFGGGAKKAIGRSQVNFPTASDLVRVGGREDSELYEQIPPLLSSFSRQIKGGLDVGLPPRQIVGGLLAESVGSKLSANGSANLRQALNKPLGGHFEWIREALGIGDVAAQAGFREKETGVPRAIKKPEPRAEEQISPAESEYQLKKARIRRYLLEEGGMDYLLRTWDITKVWEHIGEDGYLKAVYRPKAGVLQLEGVCLRRNVSDEIISPTKSAAELREETKLLERLKGPNFVRIYARSPFSNSDQSGAGGFDAFRHWELVDYVDGVLVGRVVNREERGEVLWPERLTPATRLSVLLAACHCEHEATHLTPPVYLTDLKTDAFKLQPDGVVKMIDIQHHDKAVEYSTETIVKELGRLCFELFPGQREYGYSSIEKAIHGYVNSEWDRNDRRYEYSSPRPRLEEILKASELPDEVWIALRGFLDDVRVGRLKYNEVPMELARRILPVMQRLEREETAAKGDEFARKAGEEAVARRAREEAGRRVETAWLKTAEEMAGDNFAAVGFRQTGNEIVAAAAFEFRAEMAGGRMNREMFTAMMREINGIAKSYEARLGQPPEQKLPWPQVVEDMAGDNIAKTAFDATGSKIVAAAAYRFRQGILRAKDQGASFKQMMKEINGAVRKVHRQDESGERLNPALDKLFLK